MPWKELYEWAKKAKEKCAMPLIITKYAETPFGDRCIVRCWDREIPGGVILLSPEEFEYLDAVINKRMQFVLCVGPEFTKEKAEKCYNKLIIQGEEL